ncbi:MAG: RNA polymerase sigma factor [Calditrichia bacterium]
MIVETHQEKVRNTCFRFVKNRQDADDLAQEVFMQVYESMHHFREESALSTWIYRIAVNKSLDHLRKKNRKKRLAQIVSIFGFGDSEEEFVPSPGNNPQQNLEEQQRREILQAALDRLPANQKTAIILSKYQGFGNREVAEIMELSISAVEALIHRAKKNLHKMLHEYFEKHL